MARIQRALISVSDKTGVTEFARSLTEMGVELVSTGGTASVLSAEGVPVIPVEAVTGFPEMLDGRVKTLHPLVHGGLLYRRDDPSHVETVRSVGISPVDLLCVNLYPFADTVMRTGSTVQECIENIDIGGPAMVRSAAKNHEHVTVVVDPEDYPEVLDEMDRLGGETSPGLRRRLAAKAYAHTAAYDAAIAAWMRSIEPGADAVPVEFTLAGRMVYRCRYGENPHQSAAFYREATVSEPSVATARVMGGKELSYNNICDANAALEVVKDFVGVPTCCIVKHANPCGLASADELSQAFSDALQADPVSAFGGIVAFNRVVDAEVAQRLTGKNTFFEVVVAPDYTEEAAGIIGSRKGWGGSVRLLSTGDLSDWRSRASGYDVRRVVGGVLVQDRDLMEISPDMLKVVTRRSPTDTEVEALLFAWKAVKHVKSNAIVLSRGTVLVGVGAGQMNRVQSVRLAVAQAGERARGSVLASDAFFPFADGPEAAAKAGVTAIIQPGGSKRDQETIELCDQYGIAMVYTGVRHFRH